MKVTNQKTDVSFHQETTRLQEVVAAIAQRVHHMLSSKGLDQQLIYDVCQDSAWCSVQGSKIVSAIMMAAKKALKLHKRGFDLDMIGAHSLCSGGVMALKIMRYSDLTIRKFGPWTSNTRMMHVHSQISMSTHLLNHCQ